MLLAERWPATNQLFLNPRRAGRFRGCHQQEVLGVTQRLLNRFPQRRSHGQSCLVATTSTLTCGDTTGARSDVRRTALRAQGCRPPHSCRRGRRCIALVAYFGAFPLVRRGINGEPRFRGGGKRFI